MPYKVRAAPSITGPSFRHQSPTPVGNSSDLSHTHTPLPLVPSTFQNVSLSPGCLFSLCYIDLPKSQKMPLLTFSHLSGSFLVSTYGHLPMSPLAFLCDLFHWQFPLHLSVLSTSSQNSAFNSDLLGYVFRQSQLSARLFQLPAQTPPF